MPDASPGDRASAIVYAAVAALLLGVMFELWTDVLPNALSVRIGHNTEGYILALVVAAWIQFVRPRDHRIAR